MIKLSTIPARVSEYLWKLLNWCQSWPVWPMRSRTWVLRLVGVKLAGKAVIAEGVYLGSPRLVMGKYTAINVGSFVDGCGEVHLDDYVRVGPYVRILTGTHEYRNSAVRRWPGDPIISKNVHVKRGCWLGMGCSIMPGVIIEEGCVIAAGAVVVQSTLPNGLYAGVPAKRVKDLPEDEVFQEKDGA